MGEHASVCARVLGCACMDTHVATPLLGTSAPKPSAAGKEEGAAEAQRFHCTGASQLKVGVLHEAWG